MPRPQPVPPRVATPRARHRARPTLPHPQSAGRALGPGRLSARVRVTAPRLALRRQAKRGNGSYVGEGGAGSGKTRNGYCCATKAGRGEPGTRGSGGHKVWGPTSCIFSGKARAMEEAGLLQRGSCCPHPVVPLPSTSTRPGHCERLESLVRVHAEIAKGQIQRKSIFLAFTFLS